MTPKPLYTILYTNLPRKVIFCDTITYHPKIKNPGFTGICDVLIFCEMVGRASSLSAISLDYQAFTNIVHGFVHENARF